MIGFVLLVKGSGFFLQKVAPAVSQHVPYRVEQVDFHSGLSIKTVI